MPEETTNPNLETGKSHAKQAAQDFKEAAADKAKEVRDTIDTNEKFESGKAHVKQAADDLKSAAQNKAEELRQRAGDAYDEARNRASGYRKDGEDYVRENPARAILTALGIGFLIGLIFRR